MVGRRLAGRDTGNCAIALRQGFGRVFGVDDIGRVNEGEHEHGDRHEDHVHRLPQLEMPVRRGDQRMISAQDEARKRERQKEDPRRHRDGNQKPRVVELDRQHSIANRRLARDGAAHDELDADISACAFDEHDHDDGRNPEHGVDEHEIARDRPAPHDIRDAGDVSWQGDQHADAQDQRQAVADAVAGDLFAQPHQHKDATNHRGRGRRHEPAVGIPDQLGKRNQRGGDAVGLKGRESQRKSERGTGDPSPAALTRPFEQTQSAPNHGQQADQDRRGQIGDEAERKQRQAAVEAGQRREARNIKSRDRDLRAEPERRSAPIVKAMRRASSVVMLWLATCDGRAASTCGSGLRTDGPADSPAPAPPCPW